MITGVPQPEEPREALSILFLGVGYAGMRLIAHLPGKVPDFTYAAVDTDAAALEACAFPEKLLIGEGKFGGLGAGGNPDMARECAEMQDEDIVQLLSGHKVVLLIAGLGGGTGGGVGAYIAERARDMGATVLAGVIRPLDLEGGHRRHVADVALSHIRDHANACLVFPLDVLKTDEEMPLRQVLGRCGVEVSRALGGLAVLLRTGWLMPLTLRDVIHVMSRADGYCRLAAVSAEGPDRARGVIEQLFSHPILDKGSLIAHSSGIVLGILCGPKTTIGELESVSTEIRAVLRSDASLKIGIAQEPRFGNSLGIVIMVAERWSSAALPVASDDAAEDGESGENESGAEGGGASGKMVQSEINLGAEPRGRFKGASPTVVDGEDLDTPTFIRRGIRLSHSKKRAGGS
jgi:cell division protein FtsZ